MKKAGPVFFPLFDVPPGQKDLPGGVDDGGSFRLGFTTGYAEGGTSDCGACGKSCDGIGIGAGANSGAGAGGTGIDGT